MIYPAKNLKNTLFLDIETASEYPNFGDQSDLFKKLWTRKAKALDKTIDLDNPLALNQSYANRAGIYSEFSRILCISVGYLTSKNTLRIKTIANPIEKDLLSEFSNLLKEHYPDSNNYFLCGHNIKEFDIPFICRRMMKYGVFMPNMLDIAGKKPWQTEHLVDTMELWRFGDIKSYTSLELLAAMLEIPTPKDDLDGSMVGKTYWEENDLDRIIQYCQRDVITVAKIMLRFSAMPDLDDDTIEIV